MQSTAKPKMAKRKRMIEMWLCIPYDAGCWASVLPLLVFIDGSIGAKKSGTNQELTPSL
jgi:hypothetical protein